MARPWSARCYGVARPREGSRQNSIGGSGVLSLRHFGLVLYPLIPWRVGAEESAAAKFGNIPGSSASCIAGFLQGPHNHPARDTCALAQGRLSLLLALEVAPLGGRPQIDTELRVLIRRMSMENPLWCAPRSHGELLTAQARV
jgi:hypothetical protein